MGQESPNEHEVSERQAPFACRFFAERFEIFEELGRGGMSVVYRAREVLLDRFVALKLLEKSLLKSGGLERFAQEARILSLLEHPGIVKTLSCGVHDEQAYIALELLEGQTLEAFLKERRALDKDTFAEIFIPAMDALIYAHEKNIVHRDLKPANFMILQDNDGKLQVKLLDYGLAKLLDLECQQDPQLTAAVLGTPYYLSPEQCSGKRVDQRSDIYSLACVMYESIVGKPPFSGETAFETMYEHLKKSVPQLAEISGALKIPRALFELIIEALAKDPQQRPQTMSRFKEGVLFALNQGNHLKRKVSLRARLQSGLQLLCGALLLFAIVLLALSSRPDPAEFQVDWSAQHSKHNFTVHKMRVLSLAAGLREQGKYGAALEKCKEALRIARQVQEDRPSWLYLAFLERGSCFYDLGRFEEAAKDFESAMNVFTYPTSSDRFAALKSLVAVMSDELGRQQEAFTLYRKNLEAGESVLSGEVADVSLARAYADFSYRLYLAGEYSEAVAMAKKSLLQFDRLLCSREDASALEASIVCSAALKILQIPDAEKELRKTIAIMKRSKHPDPHVDLLFGRRLMEHAFSEEALYFLQRTQEHLNELSPAEQVLVRDDCLQRIGVIKAGMLRKASGGLKGP